MPKKFRAPISLLPIHPTYRPVSPNTGHNTRYLELERKLKQDKIVHSFENFISYGYIIGPCCV